MTSTAAFWVQSGCTQDLDSILSHPFLWKIMEMLFTPQFWSALGAIMLLNLVLSGDNAIVIAMAARNLPPVHQKKAILWGTLGAIIMRIIMTLIVVWLLKIPGLKLLGGLALIWIAIQLVNSGDEADDHGKAGATFWDAMKTIIIADAVMGLDNVLAVAAAAGGDLMLIFIGLMLSIPIVVFGSTIVLKIMTKYPIVIWIGVALLGWTAGLMIWEENVIASFIAPFKAMHYPFLIAVTLLTLGIAYMMHKRNQKAEATA
jgi:YjbE family integral membrane protein